MANMDEVRRMLQQAKTPQERADAMRALQENIPESMHNSHMVTMNKGSNNNAVRLGSLGSSDNPDIFERIRRLFSRS